jgi:hypothetical protein
MNFSAFPLKQQTDAETYLWIIERENSGEKLEVFAAWAKSQERVQYFNKYVKNPQNIQLDWVLAFSGVSHSNDVIGVE